MSDMSDNMKVNADELVRSLNGYEDIAIERHFGVPLTKMSEMRAPRALIFVMRKREGMKDQDAYKAAMEMSFGEIEDIFVTEDEEQSLEDIQAAVDGRGN